MDAVLVAQNRLMGPVHSFEELAGRTLVDVVVTEDEMVFYLTPDNYVRLYHSQDCCEHVYIEDICGDVTDLIGSPLVYAEEVSSSDAGFTEPEVDSYDSQTWTYYRFQSQKGSVEVRWLGESNGYYSESVDTEVIVDGKRIQLF